MSSDDKPKEHPTRIGFPVPPTVPSPAGATPNKVAELDWGPPVAPPAARPPTIPPTGASPFSPPSVPPPPSSAAPSRPLAGASLRGPEPRPGRMPRPNVMPELAAGAPGVKLTIDGRELTVQKGTNVLEAAKTLGIDICHFCYHSGLSVAASCRQCLVDIEKTPKLTPACQAVVADGMVVHTDTPRVQDARRAMLEFTLVNHPIDCPICDKAGECTLQRHYMDHDHKLTRVDVPKIRKPKVKDIGQHIVLDAERCILCSRCVRFCDEVPGTSELVMTQRGDREEIDVAAGLRLDNPYSINVVDICPVGALTSKDFRFQVRAWELRATPSTCSGCATGCATELHTKQEHAYRVVPRHDPEVNGHWMCDEGRFTYKELASATRVRHGDLDGVPRALDELVRATAALLRDKRIGVVFSATATNEANLAAAELAQALGARRYLLGRASGEADAILRDADKNPNTRGAQAAAGPDCKHEAELALDLAGRLLEAVFFVDGTGELSEVTLQAVSSIASVVLADRETPITGACRVRLPTASWAEILGTYTNRQGLLRPVHPAFAPEGERQHPAELCRRLMVALGATDTIGGPSRLTRRLAEQARHAELLAVLDARQERRPRLLRWANSRG